ncbi:MAG TPA: IclR family transcriptional regulator [Bryobacteraceae bacterium]|nr:IclR family transcriptional regulator [Bryobacteraceae bacterium]
MQVLDRTFQILDVLAQEGPVLGVTEIATRLGLHKSTAHRLIMVLESRRFLERDMSGKCHLGSRVMQLGLAVLAQLDIAEVARPHLRRLVAETGETAQVGVVKEDDIVAIASAQSFRSLRLATTVGTRIPAHCTALGKSILAFSSRDVAASVLRKDAFKCFTPNTITSPARLRDELQRVRQLGYACDNEEWEKGLRCLSAPIRDSSREVVGAVGIAGSDIRLTENRTRMLAAAVISAASRISAGLGYVAKGPIPAESRLNGIAQTQKAS